MITYTSKTEQAAKEAFRAAAAGDRTKVLWLADHSFNLEDCDEDGNSILHYAVQGKDPEIVRFLVETGGLSPLWANQSLVTPYDLAHNLSVQAGGSCEI
mgnify:CR=1 FL=1